MTNPLHKAQSHNPLNALSKYALTARQSEPLADEPISNIQLIKCVIIAVSIAITTPIIVIALMSL